MSWQQRFAFFASLGFAMGAWAQDVPSVQAETVQSASYFEVVPSSLTPVTAEENQVNLELLQELLERSSAKVLTAGHALPAASTPNQYSAAIQLTCPTTKSGLSDGWQVFAHSLDRNAAIALSIWGSAELSADDKVILYYFTWYKDILGEEGQIVGRCGSGVQLTLKAANLKADAQITLPALAASTQLGIASVEYRLSTFGISGSAIDKAAPRAGAVGKFDAQAYAELMSSIDKIQMAGTSGAAVKFSPRLIAIPNTSSGNNAMIREALVQVSALRHLARGSSCSSARAAIPNRSSRTDILVSDLYRSIAGVNACSMLGGGPTSGEEQQARGLLAQFNLSAD